MSMTLLYGEDTVTFGARDGYTIPQHREREQAVSPNGDLIINEIFAIASFEIPVNAIPKVDYDLVYEWWDKCRKLTFTPDTDDPGTTYYVRITNPDNPLQMMFADWAEIYEGTLLLEKVPALS